VPYKTVEFTGKTKLVVPVIAATGAVFIFATSLTQ
jgi:hypothetical protein